jgi:hypothetical protein
MGLPRVVLRELTPSEAEFQARVIRLAKQRGFLCYHTFNSRRSEAGVPDLLLVHPDTGRTIWAELKVWPRLGLRPAQETWLAALRRNPHLEVYVWRWVFGNGIEQEIADILGGDAHVARVTGM